MSSTDLAYEESCLNETSSNNEPCQSGEDGNKPSSFVIVHNVSKRHNIGTIARCATAFGVKEVIRFPSDRCHEYYRRLMMYLSCMQVCLVGSRQYNTFGSHGSDAYVEFRHDHTLEQCIRRLKEEDQCTIVGVEIVEGAQPVSSHPFNGELVDFNDRQYSACLQIDQTGNYSFRCLLT